MKFCDILKSLKGSAEIQLFTKENEQQWVSNGYAAYVLEKMPKFEGETFCTAASITYKDGFCEQFSFPLAVSLKDTDEAENKVERFNVTIGDLVPFYTQIGVVWIKAKFLLALRDENEADIEYYERISKIDNQIYIVAKRGMIAIAAFMPCECGELNTKSVQRLAMGLAEYQGGGRAAIKGYNFGSLDAVYADDLNGGTDDE